MAQGGNDFIQGGSGREYIRAGANVGGIDDNDIVIAGEGTDMVYGGAGEDIIWGGGGQSCRSARKRWIAMHSRAATERNSSDDSRTTMDGPDVLYIDWASPGRTNELLRYGGSVGDDSRQQIEFGSTGNDTLTGGGLGDHLYGGAGADTLEGKGGADYLEGGTGDGIIWGNSADVEYKVIAADSGERGDWLSREGGNDFIGGSRSRNVVAIDTGAVSACWAGARGRFESEDLGKVCKTPGEPDWRRVRP